MNRDKPTFLLLWDTSLVSAVQKTGVSLFFSGHRQRPQCPHEGVALDSHENMTPNKTSVDQPTAEAAICVEFWHRLWVLCLARLS